MNVFVITEDHTNDRLIILPLIKQMLVELGKPHAKVEVCRDPSLRGVRNATNWDRIKEVLNRYQMINIFLLLIDKDGDENRRRSLRFLEAKAAEHFGTSSTFLAEHAWQEIEVWAIAGQEKQSWPKGWNWSDIRAHRDPKETYFEPLANSRNLQNEPGQGRTTLGREAAANYARVRTLCKEDIQSLEDRLKAVLAEM